MKSIGRSSGVLVLVASLGWAVVAACGSDAKSTFGNGTDSGAETSAGPTFGDPTGDGSTSFADFGGAALIDTGDGGAGSTTTPANAADLFTAASAAGGDAGNGNSPCLSEPEVGSLVPRNWLRPRFSWAAADDANLFEIRVSASNQTNDLVVYTTASQWIMPKDMWISFASHSAGADITVSIRGGKLANGAVTGVTQGSQGAWGIAPVDAPGSIVYWYIAGNLGELKGFSVGDEDTRVVLKPTDVQKDQVCIGCHTSSPDGKFALLSLDTNSNWGASIGSIETDSVGTKPTYMTAAAATSLTGKLNGITTASAAFWMTGKHYVAAARGDINKLSYVNLDDPAGKLTDLEMTGTNGKQPASPAWSHDGKRFAFTNGALKDGRVEGKTNDIYTAPFQEDGSSVAAGPLTGAATADGNEYYPTFSPDDSLIAFTRASKDDNSYAAASAEVLVVGANGGTPQRLAANDPPACAGQVSPGIENSWPKWAPAGTSKKIGDKTYYWLVFSSTRHAAPDKSVKRQLFMAPVVVDAAGNIAQYKAVYLWNQPAAESNHTPAWDVFAIPPSTGGIK